MNTFKVEDYTILKNENLIFITIYFDNRLFKNFSFYVKNNVLFLKCYDKNNNEIALELGGISRKTQLLLNTNRDFIYLNQISHSGELLSTNKL